MDEGDVAARNAIADDQFVDREQVVNVDAFVRNIFRGDVVNKKDASASYAFYWSRQDGSDFCEEESDSLEEAGYFVINEKEFNVRKWKRTAEGYIKSGRAILYAMPKERYKARQRARLEKIGANIDAHTDGFHAQAEKYGLNSYEMRGGMQVQKAVGRSTSTLLDDTDETEMSSF
jgi:hypothetical protein